MYPGKSKPILSKRIQVTYLQQADPVLDKTKLLSKSTGATYTSRYLKINLQIKSKFGYILTVGKGFGVSDEVDL